jgi:hypothetical protein
MRRSEFGLQVEVCTRLWNSLVEYKIPLKAELRTNSFNGTTWPKDDRISITDSGFSNR